VRTRTKICGITRVEDALSAAEAGADAIGFVFYAASARCIEAIEAAAIARALPPYVSKVGLFVNAPRSHVEDVLRLVSLDSLQFHGDETAALCASFEVPFIKAVRVRSGVDLLEYATEFATAQGLLLDAHVDGAYGGTGATFDWNLIPLRLPLPLILSGGLHPGNVGEAVRRVRPWAVDVSSGVESAKGIKDRTRITAFLKEVQNEDLRLT
jgi:phosphoribosylanthranilate isomerase